MILFYFAIVSFVIFLSPFIFKESSKIRYFACWLSLSLVTVLTSLFCLIQLPFSSNPRCCSNIRKGSIGGKIALKLVGVEIEGREIHKTDIHEQFIVIVNHQSFLDIIGIVREWNILGNCVPVAKKALQYYWPFGLITWMVGTIFIDRKHKGAAYKQVLQQAKKHFNKYQGKTSVLIFPEGSRGHGDEFGNFKKGAFQLAIDLQLPILPIVIAPFSFIKYLEYFKTGKFIYKVLDPLPTTGYSQSNIDAIIKKTQNLMFEEYKKLRQEQYEHSLEKFNQ